MKKCLLFLCFLCLSISVNAQEDGAEKGFKKENLFTGGSVSLSFFNNSFLIGGSPVLGYRLGRFADGGVVMNLVYSTQRDYYAFNDHLRQTLYGGGLFARFFPLNFLYGQAQYEYNFTHLTYKPSSGSNVPASTDNFSGHSFLVGGGYASGRAPHSNSPFFYMSVLWDISNNKSSPYKDNYGRSIPVIRAGFNIPLFQRSGGF